MTLATSLGACRLSEGADSTVARRRAEGRARQVWTNDDEGDVRDIATACRPRPASPRASASGRSGSSGNPLNEGRRRDNLSVDPRKTPCPLGVTGVRADPPAVAPDLIGVCAACWTETSLVSQLVLDPVRSKLAGRHGPGAFETLPHMSVPRLLFR